MSDTPWPHFSRNELACPCCGRMEMDSNFMGKMEALRYAFGQPLEIISGFRCPMFNIQSSDSGLSGMHTTGKAVDIAVCSADAYRLLTLALLHGFTGVGIGQEESQDTNFLHLDTIDNGPGRLRPSIWIS